MKMEENMLEVFFHLMFLYQNKAFHAIQKRITDEAGLTLICYLLITKIYCRGNLENICVFFCFFFIYVESRLLL